MRRRVLQGSAGLAVTVVVSLVGGCHRVFDGEIETYRCEIEGAFGPPTCPVGQTCTSGLCSTIGVPFGTVCESDGDCRAETRCVDPADYGESGPKRCTDLCCSSSDCGPAADGLICWLPAATTGGLCWPAAEVGRAAPGEGRPGSECADSSDCRSGLCQGGSCAGACCNDSYCASELVCRAKLSELAERETFACGAPAGPATVGVCNSDDDCRSGKCVQGDETLRICASPCCSSNDCESVYAQAEVRPVACTAMDGGTLRACSKLLPVGATGQVGAPCVDGDDCRGGVCLDLGSGRICSDACCNDESCGDASAFACRPVHVGETWPLRCVPK